jgi:hypothetical protein
MTCSILAFLGALIQQGAPDPTTLPAARIVVDEKRAEILIDMPAIELPAHTGHGGGGGYPPVVKVEMPVGGALYGFRVDVVDQDGRPLPAELIHHYNLIDPRSRELFLPISRRMLAAGKETGAQKLPRFLFGMPVAKGQLLVANAMLHNPSETDYPQVITRLVLQYVPEERFWPVFDGYPFQLDVGFPVGDKSFPIPPGKSTRSYEARPAVPGKIVGIGGHMHELGTRIELSEVESGKVIWSASPTVAPDGTVTGIPVGKLYGFFKVGAPIRPDRTYRVTVHYDNTTGETIEAGGMGVVGGLFVPEKGARWPEVNPVDPLFVADAIHYLRIKKVETAEHVHQPEP